MKICSHNYNYASIFLWNNILVQWSITSILQIAPKAIFILQWRHSGHDGVSNHQLHGCLLNRLFRRRLKKTSKLRVAGLCVGNSPGPVSSPHKSSVTRKMFPFDDVIMTNVANGYQFIRIIIHTACALLCLSWLEDGRAYPYSSGILHWHAAHLLRLSLWRISRDKPY